MKKLLQAVIQFSDASIYSPLDTMLAQATTHVWMMVFSWRVKGWWNTLNLRNMCVHILRRKRLSMAAGMLSDGAIPDMKIRFMPTLLKMVPSNMLATTDRTVICSVHA